MTSVVRQIGLSAPWLDEREEELVLEVMRSGRLSLGPSIDRFEELFAEAVGAPYAAAVFHAFEDRVDQAETAVHCLGADRFARQHSVPCQQLLGRCRRPFRGIAMVARRHQRPASFGGGRHRTTGAERRWLQSSRASALARGACARECPQCVEGVVGDAPAPH